MYTRNTLALISLALLVGGSVQASGSFGFGAKAGLSFASSEFDYSPTPLSVDPGWRSGFTIGAFAEYPLVPFLSIRSEAIYIEKGNKISAEETTEAYPEGTGEYIDIVTRADYVSLQLLAKGSVPRPGPSIYALAGPRLDIKTRVESDDVNFPVDSVKSTVWGVTVGGGFTMPVGPTTSLLVEFQYFHDLGDVVDYSFDEGDLIRRFKVTNKACAVTVGVMF